MNIITTKKGEDKLNIGKVVCVGRNYADHAKELGNEVPTQPLLFIKPSSAIIFINDTKNDGTISLPSFGGDVHYEAELCIQIGEDLSDATLEQVQGAVYGITVGLDLTLRDLQNQLKSKGHPWERSKSFAKSCVLGDWLEPNNFADLGNVNYQLYINDELRQDGNTALMLFPIYELLMDISQAFGLQKGDVVMTGTPKGVGKLQSGDSLRLVLADCEWSTKVG